MKPAPTPSQCSASLADALTQEAERCARHGIDPAHFDDALLRDARCFLARPGKAFRARLLEASFAVAGGAHGEVPRAALEAVELLHGGSLIIDDIQDDAATRRGEPALHRTVGTGRALNVGNWLYFVALTRLDDLDLPAEMAKRVTRTAHRVLARCHEGQALDLTLRLFEIKRSEVAAVAHTTSALKTGALLGFATGLGAAAAHAPQATVQALTTFGERVGVGLQMLDDLGSFIAPDRQHKGLEDLRGQRVNWAWAWASERFDEVTYRQLTQKVSRGEALHEVLSRVAEAVAALGRLRVHDMLERAFFDLRHHTGDLPALDVLSAELKRLEKSYG